MTAHFIDVDQAHATLLEFSCGAVLVDVGSQDDDSSTALVDYLNAFFTRRNDLSRTLNSIIIPHNHIDHTRVLRRLIETEKYVVQHYVDNGFTTRSGRFGPNWLKAEVAAGRLTTRVRVVPDTDVEAVKDKSGLTDTDIDPLDCKDQDPRIRVLQGSFEDNPGWSDGEFENQNNHSLVTRVDFGSAEFLFMGDLQEAGIELLLDYCSGPARPMLNADVLQVGHHGSHNATTAGLLSAVTPLIAIIPGPSTGQRFQRLRLRPSSIGHRRFAHQQPHQATIARENRQSLPPANDSFRTRPYRKPSTRQAGMARSAWSLGILARSRFSESTEEHEHDTLRRQQQPYELR
jgi:competence protein ComEC